MGKRNMKADSAKGGRSQGWSQGYASKGGKGGGNLTPEQTAALQALADEKLKEEKKAERREMVEETAREVRRADKKKKKKKKRKHASSDSDSDTGGSSSSSSESDSDDDNKKKKHKKKSDKPEKDRPEKPKKPSKIVKLYEANAQLQNEVMALKLSEKGLETELELLKSQLATHMTSSGSSSRPGQATITLTQKQLDDMLATAKQKGEVARTPEPASKKEFDKSDIFGAALTFVTPTATVDEGVSKETQTILDKLGEKIKEAAEVRDLTKGNGKIADKQHRVIEKLAKECADTNFTSPDSLKALKSLVKSGGVQTQASYSHTLLQAIFKCCTQRGINFTREEIGLSELEDT